MRQIDSAELPVSEKPNFEQWADGKTYEARRGEDFRTSNSFHTALRRWCKRNGYVAKTTRTEESVKFRITRPE